MFKLTNQEIEQLCEAGGLAPSGGNVQPWKVLVDSNVFTINVNSKRLAGFLDIGMCAASFALGCFMENLCIKADSLGLNYCCEIIENKSTKDAAIRIIFSGRSSSHDPRLVALAPYLAKRCTNRKIYDGTMVCEKVIESIRQVAGEFEPGIFNLRIVSNPDEKKKLAKILGKADGVRIMHDEPFKDMMDEIRWSDEEASKSRDGMDIKTLELPANMEKMLRLLNKMPYMRRIIPISAFEKMAEPVLLNCSHLCCLFMPPDISPDKIILAGRLVERIWLTATKAGISFQPWASFPFFVIRNNFFKGKAFSKVQQETIKDAEIQLKNSFGVSMQNLPIFIFRLFISKPPSARALRIFWKDFTEIKN